MVRKRESFGTHSRRNLLRLTGVAAGTGLVGAVGSVAAEDHPFSLAQGGECIPVRPLTGEEPVEELYRYAYPQNRFDEQPGVDGTSYSSEGTVDLQEDDTSILFLYDGPDGLSLVVVHGLYDEEAPREAVEEAEKRAVSFAFDGMPENGEWVVQDDLLDADGDEGYDNWDRWDVESSLQTVHWVFRHGRTDGGAFRGLATDDVDVAVDIAPAFNESAGLAEEHDTGVMESWELLSGDIEDPERTALDMGQIATLQSSSCPDDG